MILLPKKMINDMNLRRFPPKTQEAYTAAVAGLARFYNQSPDGLNRHCPKCQALTKAKCLKAHKAELFPVTYFHNVFTLPHELNPIAFCNKEVNFDILFKSVSETLLEFGRNPKNGL